MSVVFWTLIGVMIFIGLAGILALCLVSFSGFDDMEGETDRGGGAEK